MFEIFDMSKIIRRYAVGRSVGMFPLQGRKQTARKYDIASAVKLEKQIYTNVPHNL